MTTKKRFKGTPSAHRHGAAKNARNMRFFARQASKSLKKRSCRDAAEQLLRLARAEGAVWTDKQWSRAAGGYRRGSSLPARTLSRLYATFFVKCLP
jgi:hypothetical protein